MKKYFYLSAAALATLFATSCSSDDVPAPVDGDMTTFSVQLPDQLTTRFGEGKQATKLYVAVYEQGTKNILFSNFAGEGNDKNATSLTITPFTTGEKPTCQVSVPLVKGKKYDLVFFAQDANSSAYSFSTADQTMTVSYADMTNFDEARDAFFGHIKNFTSGGQGDSVTLTRPFAQINIGTADYQKYLNASGLTAQTFGMKVSGVANTLDLFNGTVTEPATNDAAATVNVASPSPENTKLVVNNTSYDYLAMGYVLVGGSATTQSTVNVSLAVGNNDAFASYPSVPVQMNYRTNIFGDLLTNSEVFNVTIDPNFGGSHNVIDGAVVEMNANGQVVCTVPALPAGVTAEQLEGKGGVALDAQGKPFFFEPTGQAIAQAMKQSSVIYLAPNTTISTNSHTLAVPQSGITVHGNGAIISGGEQDFSVNGKYEPGTTINVNLYNLNNVKVWGEPKTNTFNVNMVNCTMKGASNKAGNNLIMLRGQDEATGIVNINAENCYLQGMKVAIHTTASGTQIFNNCTFKGVGIPLNIAKKLNGHTSDIQVINCTFDNCGIAPDDTANDAYNYAAPIRVVDNGGPNNAINLLIDNCTFIDTLSEWDILLMDYREGKTWFPVKYTIQNCTPANPTIRVE